MGGFDRLLRATIVAPRVSSKSRSQVLENRESSYLLDSEKLFKICAHDMGMTFEEVKAVHVWSALPNPPIFLLPHLSHLISQSFPIS